MLAHRMVLPSIKFAGTHLYAWVERSTLRESVLPKNTTQCPQQNSNPDYAVIIMFHFLSLVLAILITMKCLFLLLFINVASKSTKIIFSQLSLHFPIVSMFWIVLLTVCFHFEWKARDFLKKTWMVDTNSSICNWEMIKLSRTTAYASYLRQ